METVVSKTDALAHQNSPQLTNPPQSSAPETSDQYIENITYEEMHIGRSGRLVRTLSLADIQAFAVVSGDVNPAHVDAEYASQTLFHGVIAHGMWGGALISTLLGTQFPGPGTIYIEQSLRFLLPVRIGDTLTITATVIARDDRKKRVTLDCQVSNQNGGLALTGTAIVIAPSSKVKRLRITMPQMQMFDPAAKLQQVLAKLEGLPRPRCGIVHPCDVPSLRAALASLAYIEPVLIGPKEKILAIAKEAQLDLQGLQIVATEHSHAACEMAMQMALKGDIEAMMKGSVSADELLHALLHCPGLLSKRRLSHVLRFDLPGYHKPILLTDAGINVFPNVSVKADIAQNAINLAHALGIAQPLLAVLASQDTINVKLPSTLDAATLCKMAERGQITGGILDGPLALDHAISPNAGQEWSSPVAGNADILLVPDLEAGNLLAKQWQALGGALHSGVVMGARIPIALCNPVDGLHAQLGSIALTVLLVTHRQHLNAAST